MFKNYINEIRNIACVNNVSMDIALNMFVNNIEDALVENDEYFYHGADHADYKALKAVWDKMPRVEKKAAMDEFMAEFG